MTYNYRRCLVIDDKGRNGLTETKEYDLVPAINGVGLIEDMLDYNFGFVFSYFLGNIPYGMACDWVLGNLFTFLNGVRPNAVLASESNAMYRAFVTSITRSDLFVGNVYGVAKHEFYDHVKLNASTNDTSYNYVKKYVDAGRTIYFHEIDPLGKIGIIGFNDTYYFSPKFYSSPGYIW